MDQSLHQLPIQTVNVATKSHQYLKKAFTVLISISIFSFFISYSSWLPLLVHSHNLYSSAYPFNLFNLYSIDRSYIFLLFNGILAYLARNSGLVRSSPFQIDRHEEKTGIQSGSLEVNYDVPIENAIVEEQSKEENRGEAEQLEEEEEQEEELNESSITYEEEEEEEEEENESLSTEELKKKCDDFIKKMREEIMFESQRLIMV